MLTQEEKRDILSIFSDDSKEARFDDIKITDENDLLYESDYYQQCDNLSYLDWGCTKLCLFFKDLPHWVIKIPISQIQREDSDDWVDFWHADDDVDSFGNDILQTLKSQGAERSDWDYCFVEAALTLAAEQEGVDDMICGTYFLGYHRSGVPVYVSKRADDCLEEVDTPQSTEEGRSLAMKVLQGSKANRCGMYNSIGELFIEEYGIQRFKKLADFIAKYQVSDLHENNFMYADNCVKIIDMAGLRD